jgi:hypothetical protein
LSVAKSARHGLAGKKLLFKGFSCGLVQRSLHWGESGTKEANMARRRPESTSHHSGVEPEIIPPGDVRSRDPNARMSFDGRQQVYVARIGPLGFAIMAVAIAILAVLFFLLVLSAFVVLLPLAGLLLAIIIAVGLFRILIWRRF